MELFGKTGCVAERRLKSAAAIRRRFATQNATEQTPWAEAHGYSQASLREGEPKHKSLFAPRLPRGRGDFPQLVEHRPIGRQLARKNIADDLRPAVEKISPAIFDA